MGVKRGDKKLPGTQGQTAGEEHFWPRTREEKAPLGGTGCALGLPSRTLRTGADPGPEHLLSSCSFRLLFFLLLSPLHFPSCCSQPALPALLLTSPLSCSLHLCVSFLLSLHFPTPSVWHPFLLPLPSSLLPITLPDFKLWSKSFCKPLLFPKFAKFSQAVSFAQFSAPNSPSLLSWCVAPAWKGQGCGRGWRNCLGKKRGFLKPLSHTELQGVGTAWGRPWQGPRCQRSLISLHGLDS